MFVRPAVIIDIDPAGGTYETIVHLAAGQTIEYGLLGLPVPQPDVKGMTAAYRFPLFQRVVQPGIAFKWLEMEGPLPSASSPSPSPSWRVLFDDLTPDQMARSRRGRRVASCAASSPMPPVGRYQRSQSPDSSGWCNAGWRVDGR
jgi:hypothetical protein